MDAHFAENVSLDDLSQLAGLSAFHLVRSFRDEVGLPPCQYQLHRRVLHVLGRLREGAPIASAAYEAGFVDQSHLNRHFKRIVGVTPGQFRGDRKSVQDRRQRLADTGGGAKVIVSLQSGHPARLSRSGLALGVGGPRT